jgi:acyl carrier protein
MSLELERELTGIIFEVCDVRDHRPDELQSRAPLIGPDSSLGLDSLDSLEIVVAVGKKYGVRIGGVQGARQVLTSLEALAEYVEKHRTRR